MKRILAVLAFLAGIALLAPSASAADSVDEAISALKTSPVFVASDATNNTQETIVYLKSWLKPGDNVVIVMLGTSDMSDADVADKILGSIKEPSILGLYVNGHFVAASHRPTVPSTATSTAMSNARTISMNPQETLATYIRQIHQYQAEHPEPTTSTSTATQLDSSSVVPYAVGVSVLLSLVLIATVLLRRRHDGDSNTSNVRFKKTPGSVKDQMNGVLDLRTQITSPDLVTSLTNIARHTEAYFRNAKVQADGTYRNVADIRKNIELLQSVVGRYIKVQNEGFYYRNEEDLKNEYSAAVFSTERFMLEQVRSANADEEFDYRKMANILSATDLRSIRQEGR